MSSRCRACTNRFEPAIDKYSGQFRRTCCNGCKYKGECGAGCTRVAQVPITPPPITRLGPIDKKQRRDSYEADWQSSSETLQLVAGDDAPRNETPENEQPVDETPSSDAANEAQPLNKKETAERDTGEDGTSKGWNKYNGWGGGWSGKTWRDSPTWTWSNSDA